MLGKRQDGEDFGIIFFNFLWKIEKKRVTLSTDVMGAIVVA